MEAFAGLSDTLKGVVVGGLISTAGVIITVAVSWLTTFLQLRHAQAENAKQRTLDLKKDAFFRSCDGVYKCLASIRVLMNIDATVQDAQNIANEGFADSAPANLIGGHETVRRMKELGELYTLSFGRLMLPKFRANSVLMEQGVIDSRIAEEDERLKQLRLREADLESRSPPNYVDLQAIGAEVLRSLTKLKDLHDERSGVIDRVGSASKELVSAALDETDKLVEGYLQVLVAMRREVGIDSDEFDSKQFLYAARMDVSRLKAETQVLLRQLEEDEGEA